jgi:hypothetical protein
LKEFYFHPRRPFRSLFETAFMVKPGFPFHAEELNIPDPMLPTFVNEFIQYAFT